MSKNTPGILQGIGAVTGGVADLASLAFSIWEYNETKKEMARQEKLLEEKEAKAEAKEETRYQTQLQMTRRQLRENKQRYEREFAESQEEKQYGRGREAMGQLLGTLARKPELERRFQEVWPARRFF
jgi:hypothetical protein